ncbi:MAG: Hsp20/alpha crystallin family protein, partial [Bacteroidetes bacterium]|nr:Hsp20/alpha crystallin family protein [Bacteroidota bacterium]
MGTLVKSNEKIFPSIPLMFDDFFARDFFNLTNFNQGYTLPAVNIQETEDRFILELAVPGMVKEDFKIELNNNNLVITAQRENQVEDEGGNYTRKEFSYKHFSRSFKLPETKVQVDNISAKYDKGILSINIPKQANSVVDSL